MDGLKQLCLHKLHGDLGKFNISANGAEMVEALEIAYDNTTVTNETGSPQELRDLVLTYALERSKELVKSKDFRTLLIKGGEFVADFTCQALGS